MKLNYFGGMLGVLLALSACTQEEFPYEAPNVSPAQLTEGTAYTVTINDATNEVTLQSLMGDEYVTSWVTPQGMAKGSSYTFSLPFSGSYEVTFGVMTRGGLVYGDPYTFTLENNNFNLLSDEIWTNLAGGVDEDGNGNPKIWVPMNANYGIGRCSGPVMYMSPNDVMNNGSGISDIKFGSDNWVPNWDPGFQSWLIDTDDPYMDSEMTLYLDSEKGSVAEVKRVTANGTQEYVTNFNLNISDPQRPLISFNSGEMLHAAWGDGVCSNYATDLKILECTPYLLQIATMRTNEEGPWWIVWNFVAKDVREDPSILPSDAPDLVEVAKPSLPTYSNLATSLFTIEGDATYIASETTLLMNEDKPYDVMYWNGADGGSWEWINGYGSSWAPAYDAADEFALTLTKKSDGSYSASLDNAEGSQSSTFTIGENTLTFADEMHFMTAGNQVISGKEFAVLICNPGDDQIVLGVPDGTDADGNVNRYLCVNLTIKPIGGGGEEGPKVLTVNPDNINCWLDGGQMRIILYQPAGWGGSDPAIDPDQLVLKKDQSLYITFRLSGIEWKDDASPRAFLGLNMEGHSSWSFDSDDAVALNKGGETTVTITNTTGSKYSFLDTDCVQIAVEQAGLVNSPLGEDGNIDTSAIGYEIVSVTIQ